MTLLRMDVLNLPRGGYLPEWGGLSPLANLFLRKVAEQIGYGETDGNNAGPFVAALKRRPWVAKKPLLLTGNKAWPGLDLGAWCGSGTSWCIEEALLAAYPHNPDDPSAVLPRPSELAAAHFGVTEKYWLANRHRALLLGNMCADMFGDSKEPIVGGVGVMTRGPGLGHVFPVIARSDGGHYYTCEFNHGVPPATVRPLVRLKADPKLLYFARVC